MRRFIRGIPLCILIVLSCKFYNPFNFPVSPTSSSINTPLNVVYTLKNAYVSEDLNLYLSCFFRDSFRFYFNPHDTVVQHILEVDLGIDSLVWGFEEEKEATEALFELSRNIYLEYLNPSWFFPSDSDSFYFMSRYYMVVNTKNGETEIAEGRLIFLLKRINNKWYIIRWEDYSL